MSLEYKAKAHFMDAMKTYLRRVTDKPLPPAVMTTVGRKLGEKSKIVPTDIDRALRSFISDRSYAMHFDRHIQITALLLGKPLANLTEQKLENMYDDYERSDQSVSSIQMLLKKELVAEDTALEMDFFKSIPTD